VYLVVLIAGNYSRKRKNCKVQKNQIRNSGLGIITSFEVTVYLVVLIAGKILRKKKN